jgi:hypothetical protein
MMNEGQALNETAAQFLYSVSHAGHRSWPYRYWLLKDALPPEVSAAIADPPFPAPSETTFDGRRETNNSTRVFFSPAVQQSHAVCKEVASAFRNPRVISAIEDTTGAKLRDGQLRIEYCQDTDGFWPEPHVDIPVKKFTMLVYLSDDPGLRDAGTDVYDGSAEHRPVATAPYECNAGMIFIPGTNTWHGFSKRPIRGTRKSIIINYVSPEWRANDELA